MFGPTVAQHQGNAHPIEDPRWGHDAGQTSCRPRLFRPTTVADIEGIVAYAHHHGLDVAVRGTSHGMAEREVSESHVIIDMTSLNAIHQIAPDRIVVDAGARWSKVVGSAYRVGATPELVPDSLTASVGGFLATGGVSGAAHRFGLALHNVLALEVVTGTGKRVGCSPSQRAHLLHAALDGGERGVVITRAVLPLSPRRDQVRTYTLTYSSLEDLLAAHLIAATAPGFDYLRGEIVRGPARTCQFVLHASVFFDASAPPADVSSPKGIVAGALETTYQTKRYAAWLARGVEGAEDWRFRSTDQWVRRDLLLAAQTALADLENLLFNHDCVTAVTLVAIPVAKTSWVSGASASHFCFAATLNGVLSDTRELCRAVPEKAARGPTECEDSR